MESILNLLKSDVNFNITIKKNDLLDFADYLINKTKIELEAYVVSAKPEKYLTRLEVCELLKVDQSSLHRWKYKGYLVPIKMGSRSLYLMSDINKMLKCE